jgi:lipopolysaccharide export system protein LptC
MLVLLAALTFWLNRVIQGDNPRGPQRHDPDYWVEHFEVRRFDIDGKLQHTLVADKLLHYPDDDTTIVTAPRITYHQLPPTEVSARMAYVGATARRSTWSTVRVIAPAVLGGRFTHGARYQDPESLSRRRKGTWPRSRGHHPGPSVIRGTGLDVDNRTGITVLHGRVTGTLHRNRTGTP